MEITYESEKKIEIFLNSIIGKIFLNGKIKKTNSVYFYSMFNKSTSFGEFISKTNTASNLSDYKEFDEFSLIFLDLKNIIN